MRACVCVRVPADGGGDRGVPDEHRGAEADDLHPGGRLEEPGQGGGQRLQPVHRGSAHGQERWVAVLCVLVYVVKYLVHR